ncbi:hypothetical protein HYT25_01290 [Candidatus Pacearchaeota archaeon]|nr:hypothetical protein [Candidatus Pacearchaeota archaeon]
MANKLLIFALYLVFGFYFVNYPFNFVEIPEIITNYNSWIVLIGGILILAASINFLKSAPHMPK